MSTSRCFKLGWLGWIGAFWLGACSGPDVYEGDILHGGEQVQVEVRSFVDEVDVENLVGRQNQGRLMAQFRIVNEQDEPLRLNVHTEWQDADGFRLPAARGGQENHYVVLRSAEERVLTFTSSDRQAARFQARVEHAARPRP
ncbi:MAG: hypothetical protein DWQ01_17045 [Planctomycetota bacterium]|nr:MAG: hypothetical protein DWQ01_17045 [Planctomycetota bacterium]